MINVAVIKIIKYRTRTYNFYLKILRKSYDGVMALE